MKEADGEAQHIVATLADLGVEADATDAAVIAALLSQFEPAMRELLAVDLADVAPEVDCDPSEPPR